MSRLPTHRPLLASEIAMIEHRVGECCSDMSKRQQARLLSRRFGLGKHAVRQILRVKYQSVAKWMIGCRGVSGRKLVDGYYFNTWNEGSAYWLGYLLTDGCMSDTGEISIGTADREIPVKLKACIMSTHRITRSATNFGTIAYRMSITSPSLSSRLSSLGMEPRKSHTVRVPRVPLFCLRHFLRGVVDGNGSIICNKSKGSSTQISTGSLEFARGLVRAISRLGFVPRVYSDAPKDYFLRYSVRVHSTAFAEALYKDSDKLCRLERKFRRAVPRHSLSVVGGPHPAGSTNVLGN